MDQGQQVRDQTAGDWRREHFIPLAKCELIRLLAAEPPLAAEQAQFLQLCRLMEATLHHQYHQRLEELKRLYAAFNPDSVTCQLQPPTGEAREQALGPLFERFVDLLARANYRQLSRGEIEQVVGIASDWGVRLQVDFTHFERLGVFVRGEVSEQRIRRRWCRGYRPEQVGVSLYQRLVVIFRLRGTADRERHVDPQRVYIKIFKNIPKQDVDMLLPCTRFKMSALDFGRVLLPTLSGLAIAISKILKGALVLAFAGFYGLLALLGLVGGTVGYGVKSFLGYLRTKDRYQLTLTRSLYYQNLDNNAGVLFHVLDEAEEQEFREAILAYALLHSRAGESGWPADRLDREAESYLGQHLGFPVDFEVHDALDKLQRMGCILPANEGCWRARPPAEALLRLDEAWDNFFRYYRAGEAA